MFRTLTPIMPASATPAITRLPALCGGTASGGAASVCSDLAATDVISNRVVALSVDVLVMVAVAKHQMP